MISDVLVCFVVFQSVFFLLDSYIYSRMNRNIARKGENQSFCALVIVHLFYLVFNSLWSMQEYGFLHLARQSSVRFLDAGAWGISLAYDMVHFSGKGHRLFAENLARYIENV